MDTGLRDGIEFMLGSADGCGVSFVGRNGLHIDSAPLRWLVPSFTPELLIWIGIVRAWPRIGENFVDKIGTFSSLGAGWDTTSRKFIPSLPLRRPK
jgi:hypothetical protein